MIEAPSGNQPSRLFVIGRENDKLNRRTSEDGGHGVRSEGRNFK